MRPIEDKDLIAFLVAKHDQLAATLREAVEQYEIDVSTALLCHWLQEALTSKCVHRSSLLRLPLGQGTRRFVLLTPRESVEIWLCSPPPVHLVIVQGGDTPMHPAWVRSLRDQCIAAGVPFYFAGWGDWCPITDLTRGYDHLYKSRRKAKDSEDQEAIDDVYGRDCIVETSDISWDGSHPGGYRVVNDQPSYMVFRVGADKSGRMLDGREWLELPGEVTE